MTQGVELLHNNEHNKDNGNNGNNEDNEVNLDDNNEELNDNVDSDDLMLSTIDNPYSPKVDYDMWKRWDNEHEYNTEEYIARLINMEEVYDVDDEYRLNVLTSKVINDILENDDLGLYILT